MPIAAIYGQGTATKMYYIITDAQNTPRRLIDSSTNAVAWAWDSTAFGVAPPSVATVTFNLRFPGQYFDAITKQHYNLNRYYNPELGRYMEADPIGLEGGLNPYAYAGSNPVMNTDPSGLSYTAMSNTEMSNYSLERSINQYALDSMISNMERQDFQVNNAFNYSRNIYQNDEITLNTGRRVGLAISGENHFMNTGYRVEGTSSIKNDSVYFAGVMTSSLLYNQTNVVNLLPYGNAVLYDINGNKVDSQAFTNDTSSFWPMLADNTEIIGSGRMQLGANNLGYIKYTFGYFYTQPGGTLGSRSSSQTHNLVLRK